VVIPFSVGRFRAKVTSRKVRRRCGATQGDQRQRNRNIRTSTEPARLRERRPAAGYISFSINFHAMKKLKTKPYTQRSRTKRALLRRAINDALKLIYTCFSIALVKNKAAKLTLLTPWRRLRGMCVVGHEASEGESKSFRNVRTSGDCCLVALMSGLKTIGVGWIGAMVEAARRERRASWRPW
jgi:hypothetical protein